MFVGLLMLTAAWGVTQNGWVICYAWSLFFYSVGVGTFHNFHNFSKWPSRRSKLALGVNYELPQFHRWRVPNGRH